MPIKFTKGAAVLAAALALAACGKGGASRPAPATGGAQPGEAPVATAGLTVTRLATGLQHPRTVYPLPNGDILIVESTGPAVPVLRPRDLIAGPARPDTDRAGRGRITLVRPGPDGGAVRQTILLDGLNAPSGVALVGTDLYVANTDALVRYPYNTGDTRITAPGTRVIALPAGPVNRHWTRSLLASDDGKKLYVGVGASTNIAENGMAAEQDRATILVVDRATGAVRPFAGGLRNPDAMQWEPHSMALWAVVDERAGAGPDLVPDYLAAVKDGGFYGWPYSYNGGHLDARVMPQRPDLVAGALAPDYPFGAGVSARGLAFNNPASTMPPRLRDGAFLAHGGRQDSGKVVFVPFVDGKPVGQPIDVVTGFGPGRPAGLIMDHRGALLIADDVGNTVWRVSGPPLK